MMSYMNRRRGQKGFTLIELLIVVAIIGIIAAILIPNLIDSLQKAKQKRTMSDMKAVGTCWFSWVTDQIGAAAAGGGTVRTYNIVENMTEVTQDDLLATLNQSDTFFYCQEVPTTDGWGNDMQYLYGGNPLNAKVIAMRSTGRNDAFETDSYTVGPYFATQYDNDIVWADGFFVYYPAGVQQVLGNQ